MISLALPKPRLLMTNQVIAVMSAEVLAHRDIETGWGQYGLLLDEVTTYLGGVIRPSADDIVRMYARTNVGGQKQADAVRWLQANHRLMATLGIVPRSARFAYLFKGHSHHHLGFGSFSGTDMGSILEAVEVDGLEVAIGTLATIDRLPETRVSAARQSGTIGITQQSKVWLRFYYLSRAMVQAGQREPILLRPEVVDIKDVPLLPPLGWQFTREDDYLEQLRLFHSFGCAVQVFSREIRDGPPFEVQFLVSKAGWKSTLSIITPWNYPEGAPTFQFVNGTSPVTGELWYQGCDLIDGVFKLIAAGEL